MGIEAAERAPAHPRQGESEEPELPSARRPAPGLAETACLSAAMLAIACLRVWVAGGPQFVPDSYQYLSVAEQLRDHGTASTSIVHFDVERAHGRLPAPATTFPAGYPALVALLSLTGLDPAQAALSVSLVAALGVLFLIRAAGAALGLSPTAARVAMLAWAFSAQAGRIATTLLSESLFTWTSLAAVVLLLQAADGARAPRRLGLAAALVGGSYHVRYAGLLFAAALHLLASTELARGRNRRGWASAIAICDALIAAGFIRNLLLTGTWQGGNTTPVSRSVWSFVHPLVFSGIDMLLGDSAWLKRPWSLPSAFAAVTLAGVLILATTFARSWGSSAPVARGRGEWVLALWTSVYCAGMCYLAVTSVISFGVRMFVPILPLVLLIVGVLLNRVPASGSARETRRRTALAVALAGSYAAVNLVSLVHFPRVAPHARVASALELPSQDGRPLSRWFQESVPRDAVLLSMEGQPTGYVLGRSVVSAVDRTFSVIEWTEETTRDVMAHFGARYLVIYPEGLAGTAYHPGDEHALFPGLQAPFFGELAAEKRPPWLRLIARNRRALIFEARP